MHGMIQEYKILTTSILKGACQCSCSMKALLFSAMLWVHAHCPEINEFQSRQILPEFSSRLKIKMATSRFEFIMYCDVACLHYYEYQYLPTEP